MALKSAPGLSASTYFGRGRGYVATPRHLPFPFCLDLVFSSKASKLAQRQCEDSFVGTVHTPDTAKERDIAQE